MEPARHSNKLQKCIRFKGSGWILAKAYEKVIAIQTDRFWQHNQVNGVSLTNYFYGGTETGGMTTLPSNPDIDPKEKNAVEILDRGVHDIQNDLQVIGWTPTC